jgi:hypothetical protein
MPYPEEVQQARDHIAICRWQARTLRRYAAYYSRIAHLISDRLEHDSPRAAVALFHEALAAGGPPRHPNDPPPTFAAASNAPHETQEDSNP